MTNLEPLATELKAALGTAPEAWQRAQREQLRERMSEPRQRPAAFRVAAFAAALLTFVLVLAWGTLGARRSGDEAHGINAQATAPIRLDDGSSIVLAPGGRGRLVSDESAVRFDLQSGRAQFDVIPGQKRPWTITAGKNEVKVVGTRFSVAYDPSGAFEVDVERGAVSVRVPERRASVELKAGDHLRGGPGRIEVAQGATEPAREPEADAPVVSSLPSPTPSAAPVTQVPPVAPAPAPSAPSVDWRSPYRAGKYAEALALLRSSRVTERLEGLEARTLAEIADVARLGGDPKLAARALTLLVRQYPRAVEARDAQFLLGRVRALSGDQSGAIRAFETYLEAGGSKQYANEATGRLMELYAERGDEARARTMAQRYLANAPKGPYHRLALSLSK